MEDAALRARRYEKALEMIWGLTRGKSGGRSGAERDIAVALGLRARGTVRRPPIPELSWPQEVLKA